ncbi:uncharacterized protein LOC126868123 [Bombus huntii]|uniref:uncharacterized protein LOC126868123 n=1 Tax=Bombus huntii TaxID=85661 RepID=UPI0021A9FDB4|nr:uncharacterized protein LOC126868123 [Bombus huntii]
MDKPVWLVFIYKLGISSVLLVQKIGLRLPVFRGIIYFVMDTSVNTQILIFVCILFLIEERFRHLCNMVPFSKGNFIFLISFLNMQSTDRSIEQFDLRQIWWLHCSLANATEMLNSVYAIQLLLWIMAMSFNLLSRIYSLKVHKLSVYWKIRELMLVTDCAWKLILIITMCHMTANPVHSREK